jgi:hypothetical protein
VKYSPSGVKYLLHRLGFVYKKPKHVPGKLDPEKQAAFIAEYEKLRKNTGKSEPVYFGDATHPQYNSIPTFGWIRRGVEKELKSNGGRRNFGRVQKLFPMPDKVPGRIALATH